MLLMLIPGFPLEEILRYMMNYTLVSFLSCVVSIGSGMPLHFSTRFCHEKICFSWNLPGHFVSYDALLFARDHLEPSVHQ